jgi:phenylalanyl-tRNA synthetase beta subunit
MSDRVLVVVPTYNERENVRPLLADLLAQGDCVNVWVADDGSPDGTADVVREVMAEHPGRVDLLLRKEKAGRGAAVIAAFKKGLADPRAHSIFFEMDADFSHHPRELPKFPEVRRDLSLVVDASVTFDQLRQIAQRTEKKLLQSVNVFDVYAGENLGAGKKSYSVSFTLQDFTQTLSEQAIDQVMQRLIGQFEKQAGALIRK